MVAPDRSLHGNVYRPFYTYDDFLPRSKERLVTRPSSGHPPASRPDNMSGDGTWRGNFARAPSKSLQYIACCALRLIREHATRTATANALCALACWREVGSYGVDSQKHDAP